MRKVSILVLVCLLAVTGIMGAMAFSSATITNAAGVVTIETDSALLALSPNEGVGKKDKTAYIEDGVLKFNFAAGLENSNSPPWSGKPSDTTHGLQPGSVYIFKDLFRITNNSHENVRFNIKVNGDLADFAHMYIGGGVEALKGKAFTLEDGKLVAPKPALHSDISWYYPGNNFGTINPAINHWNYTDVSIAFVIPVDAEIDLGSINGTIVVDAWAIQ